MAEETVSVTADGSRAVVRWGHPKANCLTSHILRDLREAVEKLGRDDTTQVILLSTDGVGAFCGGASLDEIRGFSSLVAAERFFVAVGELLLAIRRCPKLVFTRVQGRAVGGALGIIAASDYVVASPEAALRLSELAAGLGPHVIAPFLEEKIGRAALMALAIDTEWRDAQWGVLHGLYAQVSESPTTLDEVLEALLRHVVASDREARKSLKKAFLSFGSVDEADVEARAHVSAELAMRNISGR